MCAADGTEIIPQLDLRFALDLYAGVRPIRSFAGLPGPLADPRAAQIDLVLVRESTEGLFYRPRPRPHRRRWRCAGGLRHDEDHAQAAPPALRLRLALARQRKAQGKPGRVTNVDKANVFASMAFWRQVFDERAQAFPDVPADTPMSTRWR